jgi:CRISPR-associated endonuclease/helicase Cas3
VVEQSVDIDLDFIVSDLAPTDMLLQRLGRLWRHSRERREADAPELWIRLPSLPESSTASNLKRALGRSAKVYAPYVLLRTMRVWASRTGISLPSDIRPLLEATYAAPDTSDPEPWQDLAAELAAEKFTLEANAIAATQVLGRPPLDDEEEILTRRRGAPTKPLVLLRSIVSGQSGWTRLEALDGSVMEVSDHEWRRTGARFLHSWVVRAPRWFVPEDLPCPPWLKLHLSAEAAVAVVGEDGSCHFSNGPSPTSYIPTLGLYQATQQPAATPRRDDDDEFDY